VFAHKTGRKPATGRRGPGILTPPGRPGKGKRCCYQEREPTRSDSENDLKRAPGTRAEGAHAKKVRKKKKKHNSKSLYPGQASRKKMGKALLPATEGNVKEKKSSLSEPVQKLGKNEITSVGPEGQCRRIEGGKWGSQNPQKSRGKRRSKALEDPIRRIVQ